MFQSASTTMKTMSASETYTSCAKQQPGPAHDKTSASRLHPVCPMKASHCVSDFVNIHRTIHNTIESPTNYHPSLQKKKPYTKQARFENSPT